MKITRKKLRRLIEAFISGPLGTMHIPDEEYPHSKLEKRLGGDAKTAINLSKLYKQLLDYSPHRFDMNDSEVYSQAEALSDALGGVQWDKKNDDGTIPPDAKHLADEIEDTEYAYDRAAETFDPINILPKIAAKYGPVEVLDPEKLYPSEFYLSRPANTIFIQKWAPGAWGHKTTYRTQNKDVIIKIKDDILAFEKTPEVRHLYKYVWDENISRNKPVKQSLGEFDEQGNKKYIYFYTLSGVWYDRQDFLNTRQKYSEMAANKKKQ